MFGVIELDLPTRSVSGQTRYLMPPPPVKMVSATGQALVACAALKRVTVVRSPKALRCTMLK